MDTSPQKSRSKIWIVIAAIVIIGLCIGLTAGGRLIASGVIARPTLTPYVLIFTATPQGLPDSAPTNPPTEPPPTPQPPPPKPTPTAPYNMSFPELPKLQQGIPLGISVGPHLPSRSDLLDQMDMEWVKIYDTPQIADYPNHHVLFRIETNYRDLANWEAGLYNLAPELRQRGAVAVEIGNEPNLAEEWYGNPNPIEYTDALCRAYKAIKETAPELFVVSGGLAPAGFIPGQALNDLDFARAMLDAGAGNCFDAFGYHPYGFDQPPEADPNQHEMSFRRTERVHALLDAYGLGSREIWITEFGWLRDPIEEGVDCTTDQSFTNFLWMTVPRRTQALYTARAVTYAADNWEWAGPMFLWNLNWNLYDREYEPICSHLRWFGVLDSHNQPLPVYGALQQIAPLQP